MNLEHFASDLKSQNHFIKASFGGFQGSGKTRTATEFLIGAYKELKCTKPVLFLDNEKGSRFLIPLLKKNNIPVMVKDTTNLADVIQAFNFLENKEIDFLFIDSLTKIYYKFIKDYKLKNKRSFMSLMDWGKILPAWQEEFSDRFVNTEGNIVFTGRGGFEYDKEDDQTDEHGNVTEKGQFVKSGIKMKIAGETPYETDLNVWMQLEKELIDGKPKQSNVAFVLKDRSDTINGKSFVNPKYSAFKPIIRFIQGLPIGEIAKETFDQNFTPGNDRDYFERQLQRKIEVEKIEAIFELNNLGSPRSAQDKKVKTSIIQKIFNTTSKTEIEKMDGNELNFRRQELEELFKELEINTPEDPTEFIMNYNNKSVDLFSKAS
ncbi:MAG: AAA family ATPase [Ignavibacteriales bacterium]|nr:AAA family ATPase [Ignavibacteriales bacterium]